MVPDGGQLAQPTNQFREILSVQKRRVIGQEPSPSSPQRTYSERFGPHLDPEQTPDRQNRLITEFFGPGVAELELHRTRRRCDSGSNPARLPTNWRL
jgi:hypothetical protein